MTNRSIYAMQNEGEKRGDCRDVDSRPAEDPQEFCDQIVIGPITGSRQSSLRRPGVVLVLGCADGTFGFAFY